MHKSKQKFIFLLFIFIQTHCLIGQQSALNLTEIMAGNEYIGQQPTDYYWGPNSDKIYFRWNKNNNLISPYYVYSLKKESLKKLHFPLENPTPIDGYLKSDSDNCVFFKSGNSTFRMENNTAEIIYTSTQKYSLFNVVNNALLIKQNGNLHAIHTDHLGFIQLTNFKKENKPKVKEKNNFLENQQIELFETVRSKKAKKMAEADFSKSKTTPFLSPFYLEDWNLDNMAISTDFSILVFTTIKQSTNNNTEYTVHITENGYTKTNTARPKIGSTNPLHQLFIWNFKKDSAIEIDFSHLTDLHRIPEFYANYPDKKIDNYTKELIYHLHEINKKGDKCLVEIKSYDNKDRWLGYVNLETGKFTELNHQHNSAWIGGPGITGWNMVAGNAGWIDSETFYFQSEESGYSHVYTANTTTKKIEALTTGKFEIHSAQLSKDKSFFFISANKIHPGNREFYTVAISTKKNTPLLTADGNHKVVVSPNEEWLLINYSYKNKPWDLYLAPTKKNTEMVQITQSKSEAFSNYNWREPEVITFNANDGEKIHARIYEPDESKKNGAAIFFVHGAGYLQNAHNWWSGYYREYMFNNLLCDMGFTVLDVDYRASKGYGRDYRTGIYRYMGGKDLSDHLDARDYLIANYGIDSNRIGMYGGSYGGFITIMALLTEPGKFKCGAAVRSVTDWAHYNHAYTSNILNTPNEDPIAFKRSSPIYFAENLKDHLVMFHGMVDNNVQYQDVVRLSQRFIEKGITNWDLIGYPVEPHGFKETTSWVDEYGRILKLFKNELIAL